MSPFTSKVDDTLAAQAHTHTRTHVHVSSTRLGSWPLHRHTSSRARATCRLLACPGAIKPGRPATSTRCLRQVTLSRRAMAHQPRDAEAPLLAKPDATAPAPAPAVKRNKYPFFCAVLASMTSVLTGYSTRILARWITHLHLCIYVSLHAHAESRTVMPWHARRRQTWR
jgi:hypothetical protein